MPGPQPIKPFAVVAEAAERVPLLVVVARAEAALGRCVAEAFAGCESARVILDRRSGERRREARAVGVDRRATDRRDHLTVGEQLRSQGWVVIYRPFL